MNFRTLLAMLVFGVMLIASTESRGQILSYTTSTDGALNSVAAHTTGTSLVRVNGATTPGSSCSTGFSSSGFSSTTTYSSSLAAVEVSVTPAASYSLNVTGFNADLRRSGTGPASLRFAYSTNGGSTWTAQSSNQTNPSASCGGGSTLTWATSFTVTAPNILKFRIYGFNASSATGTEQILNLKINGTVTSSCSVPTLASAITNVSCNGGNNGAVTLTTTGGTTPFTYSWSTGATAQNISNLVANTYRVTVTANGGCTATASAAVSQPSILSANITATTNTTCGTGTGSATITASGGTSGYTYLWSTAQTTATASGLASGTCTVTVKDAHNCSATASATISIQSPSGLSAGNITSSGATLNWSAVAGSISYNVQYRLTGTSSWTTTTSATNSVSISGLTASTPYEFQVQTVCSSGSSSFSASTNFTTTGSCGVPTGLAASSVTSSSATLGWGTVTGAVSYNIQYRITGTGTWTATTSSTTSKSISGLTSSTTYEFQVQTVCSGANSSFSASVNFTTAVGSTVTCDSTLWNHVYHNYRFTINNACTYATGTVASKANEADGDIHIRVSVDPTFTFMLNSYNTSGQGGHLVCEPVCALTVTQSDAIAACQGFSNTVYIPNVGEHIKVTGPYVTDNDHGWNEIHPITSIVITTQTQGPVVSGINEKKDDDLVLNVFPNPTSDFVYFKLSKQPSSPVYITIVDAAGRSAGQYQMLETTKLEVNTTYLPNGIYYYDLMQNNSLLHSGRFLVGH